MPSLGDSLAPGMGSFRLIPFLPLRDLADFLRRYASTDKTAWVREVRGWARKLRSYSPGYLALC